MNEQQQVASVPETKPALVVSHQGQIRAAAREGVQSDFQLKLYADTPYNTTPSRQVLRAAARLTAKAEDRPGPMAANKFGLRALRRAKKRGLK